LQEETKVAIMNTQLGTWLMLEHALTHNFDVEVVTQQTIDTRHRYSYADMAKRTYQLMNALDSLGLERGDRVGTLAWNNYRHLECYFAVPCTERILHTLNARLSPEDLAYIINDAEDRVIFAEPELVEALEKISNQIPSVQLVVVMGDDRNLPKSGSFQMVSYESLIAPHKEDYPYREIDENTPAGLCYTSGTTGQPKGALYTHRSTYLHAMGCGSAAGMSIGPSDAVLPVVPMFHANAWGMVYAAVSVGAKLVFAYPHLHPESFVRLLRDEEVTISAGVPTVWIQVAEELSRSQIKLPNLREIVSGGSQPPKPLIARYRDEFNIPIIQAWGMTETSPLASTARPKHHLRSLPKDELLDKVYSQGGIPLPGITISLRGDDGAEVPADGQHMGNLFVKGAWVIDSYFKGKGKDSFSGDGYFATGDVAIKNSEGYFVIADRTKDLVKSGGEWISSVAMEGAIMGMEQVAEAAVVAVPDEKWQERPVACIVPKPGCNITLEEVREHLIKEGFPKWQLPDRVEIIDAVPRTSVGKFDKKVLRSQITN
jgi:fatty-acyl-CoA synthase